MVKVFYHGTVLEYIDEMFERYGCYKHNNGKPVFLSRRRGYAIEIALVRAEQCGGTPALMVIDESLLRNVRIEHEKGEIWPCVDEIPEKSFAVGKIIREVKSS